MSTTTPPGSPSDANADGPALAARIDAVLERIDAAAQRAGREPADIQILLATKTRTPAEVAEALRLLRERGREAAVGENRAQEMVKHSDPLLADDPAPRHFIGRLQTNKARDVIAFAPMIESVDRDGIIDALQRRAELADVERDVLIQVNTSGEESKGGFEPDVDVVRAAIEHAEEGGRLHVRGLMTIGANTTDEASVRASLRSLRDLRDALALPQVRELSMGMSGDLEIAIEEGATIVRLGSAVFGPRPAPARA